MTSKKEIQRPMCIRVLLEDGETERATHFRVVDANDYDEALTKIERLESMLDIAQKAALQAQKHAIAMGDKVIAATKALSADSSAPETKPHRLFDKVEMEDLLEVPIDLLRERFLIQKEWLGLYAGCIDGFGLTSGAGLDSYRLPRDIRRAFEMLQRSVQETSARPVYNHERDCGLTNDAGTCECPQPSQNGKGDSNG